MHTHVHCTGLRVQRPVGAQYTRWQIQATNMQSVSRWGVCLFVCLLCVCLFVCLCVCVFVLWCFNYFRIYFTNLQSAPEQVTLVVNIGSSCTQSAPAPRNVGDVSSSNCPPAAHGTFLVVLLQPSVDHAEYHLPS